MYLFPNNTADIQTKPELLKHLLQEDAIGYALVDKQNCITAITKKFSSILNTKATELVGRPLSTIKANNSKQHSRNKLIKLDIQNNLQWVTKPLKGKQRNNDLKLLALFDESADRRIQTLFRKQNELLEFGSTMAAVFHELVSPLAVITSAAELMLEENKHLNKDFLNKLTMIRDESYRLSMLMKSLLNFTNNSMPALSAQNLTEILEKVRRSFNLLSLKQVEISIRSDSKLPLVVGDADMLYQLFFNLLKNAIDASTENTKVLIRIRRSKTRLSDNISAVEIAITDNGIGMDSETIKHIFEPFFTTKPVGKGTGLGMSIARKIVDTHNGTLQLQSSLGNGTTAMVCLPVWKPKSSKSLNHKKERENTG